jgi:endoglucanase
MKTVFLFLTILFSTSIGYAQGFLKTSGTKIVNAKGENVLLRGIGLGGWMLQEGYMLRVYREAQQHRIRARAEELIGPERTQEFYDAWLKNHTTRADIDAMKSWGFNSVRLPMHFNLYTLPVDKEPVAGQNTWLEKGFAITDSLLAWCKANQMYLILDLHAAPGGQGNDLNISDRDGSKPSLWESEAHQQKTIALWRKLAERYKDEPWIAAYDLINEPNWGFEDPNDKNGLKEKGNMPLKKLMADITKAIREVDQKHIIIIEGNGWGNNYNGILPPWDKNMVLSFHKYWNYNNEQSIAHILRFREQYQVPVWLGETGENSNVWFTEAIRLLETHNIGWAWWPLKKIGTNNPLEVLMNEGYVKTVEYWNDPKKEKPSAEQAYSGLMELANSTRFDKNVYHKDVIDAMIRQPFSRETKPFEANVVSKVAFIHAVDYDLGINGEAYYDLDTANYRVSDPKKNTAGNKGRDYRNDGVDIGKDEGYYVSDIETGEWLQYTIDVAEKGTYKLELHTSADNANGKIALLLDGKKVGNEVVVPKGNWHPLDAGSITLSKGKHKLRVLAARGGFNLKELQFSKK